MFIDVSNDGNDQAYIGVGLITRIDSHCGGMALISTTHGEATQTQLKLIDLAATLRRRGLVLQVEPDPVEPAQPEPQPAGRGPEQISVEQMLSRLNIVDLIGAYSELRLGGSGVCRGAWPFCHGKRDFAVQGQGYLCSECGIAGNAIDFVVRAELLANRIGYTIGSG